MKKVFCAMAILVVLGMGFIGCAQPEDQTKKDSGIPQKELPKSVGENLFKGNTYVYSKESYDFTENEAIYKYGGITEKVFSYTYNTEKKLLAFKLAKLPNMTGDTLVTPEQYVEEVTGILTDEQKHRAFMEKQGGKPMSDAEWQAYLNTGKANYSLPESASYQDLVNASKAMIMPVMNYYFLYTIDGASLKLIEYSEPTLTLKQYYTDYAIPTFNWYENRNSISTRGNEIYVSMNGIGKTYIITDVSDTVIKAKLGLETVDIPYIMTTADNGSLQLTVTVNNVNYTLSNYRNYTTYRKQ